MREIRREFQWSRAGARDAQWAFDASSTRRATSQLSRRSSPGRPSRRLEEWRGGGPRRGPRRRAGRRMIAHRSLRVLIALPRWPDAALAYGGWVRQAFEHGTKPWPLCGPSATRPGWPSPAAGFPGRAAAIRTTTVIADDAWAMVGTGHWRRRGGADLRRGRRRGRDRSVARRAGRLEIRTKDDDGLVRLRVVRTRGLSRQSAQTRAESTPRALGVRQCHRSASCRS